MDLETVNAGGKEVEGAGRPDSPLSHGVSITNSSYTSFFLFLMNIIEQFDTVIYFI